MTILRTILVAHAEAVALSRDRQLSTVSKWITGTAKTLPDIKHHNKSCTIDNWEIWMQRLSALECEKKLHATDVNSMPHQRNSNSREVLQ